MTVQNNTLEVIGHVVEVPGVYKESGKVPFTRCLLAVKKVKRGDNDWEDVPSSYQRVVLAYNKLVSLFEVLQSGDSLHLHCREVSKLHTDGDGFSFEVNNWIARGVKNLDEKTAHRLIDCTDKAKAMPKACTDSMSRESSAMA